MIAVSPQDAPGNFDADVKTPGENHLRDNPPSVPVPTSYWKGHGYWTAIRQGLWEAYNGFCCYCCVWIEPSSSYWGNVEHFRPKSKHPSSAYSWENYRLASPVPNRDKGEHEDVLDPFTVGTQWFAIDMATLDVVVGPEAPMGVMQQVRDSIDRLHLNREEHRLSRRRHVNLYLTNQMTLEAVAAANPFLAQELERAGL